MDTHMSELVKAVLMRAGFEENEKGAFIYDDGESLYEAFIEVDEEGFRAPELCVAELVDDVVTDIISLGQFLLRI